MGLLGPELLVLALLLIILLKPKIVRNIGRELGKMVREFKRGSERREQIYRVARELKIDTRGKDEEEILREIKKKLFE